MQIAITGDALSHLLHIRIAVEKDLGGMATWNQVMEYLMRCYVDNKSLSSKLKSRESTIDEIKTNQIKTTEEFLRLSLTRPTIPFMALQQNNTLNQATLNPPPPTPPKPLLPINVTVSEDTRNDFKDEIKQIFNNTSESDIKPSDVIKVCKPTHETTLIKETDEPPPKLEKIIKDLKRNNSFYKVIKEQKKEDL